MAEGRGRPTSYTPEIAAEICRRMADGESLREVCRDVHMPAESTVRLWHVEDREGFSAHYTRAREAQAHFYADEIVDIADDGTNDWIVRQGKDGEESWQANGEHLQRSRLRVDTRKWLLAKVLPKIYGERVVQEHTGKDGGPIETADVTDAARARGIAQVIAKSKGAQAPG